MLRNSVEVPPTLPEVRSTPSSRQRWKPHLACGPARQSHRPPCYHRPRRAPRPEVQGTSPAQPILCDAIGVSLRRVVNLLRGCRIHWFGPLALRVSRNRADLVCKTELPHGQHSARRELKFGGFVDSPTRHIGAVVTNRSALQRSSSSTRYLATKWRFPDKAAGDRARGARGPAQIASPHARGRSFSRSSRTSGGWRTRISPIR